MRAFSCFFFVSVCAEKIRVETDFAEKKKQHHTIIIMSHFNPATPVVEPWRTSSVFPPHDHSGFHRTLSAAVAPAQTVEPTPPMDRRSSQTCGAVIRYVARMQVNNGDGVDLVFCDGQRPHWPTHSVSATLADTTIPRADMSNHDEWDSKKASETMQALGAAVYDFIVQRKVKNIADLRAVWSEQGPLYANVVVTFSYM
jgi:hypothetical protein